MSGELDLLELGYFLYMEEEERKKEETVVSNQNAASKEG